MNENSKQPAPTVNQWLADATAHLRAADIPSARLDAELILSYVLGKDRTWLLAHPDEPITDDLLLESSAFPAERRDTNAPLERSEPEKSKSSVIGQADALVKHRLRRVPIAYLTGHKEFYGRDFIVTPDVLIPRPESEMMIHVLKDIWPALKHGELIDVGTGSGALGITAMLEIPGLIAYLSDISERALIVAKQNARKWGLKKQQYYPSDLLSFWHPNEPREPSIDIILANLPYVNPEWERSPETNHEPKLALFAADNGMELIKKLITQAENVLKPGGYLLLEADPEQHEPIIQYGAEHNFTHARTDDYVITLQR